jgi:hypothetical protein
MDLPAFTGLGGLSMVAGTADADHTGARAAAAARAWSTTRPPMSFPFQEILEHFGAVGRMHVEESVLLPLRAVATAEVARDRWPLPLWLPSTVDQETSTYDGHLLTDLLLSVVDLDEEHSVTQLLAGLVADLLSGETTMLRTAPGRQQHARTAAVAAMLSRLSTSDAGTVVRSLRAASHIVFADFAADFAASTLAPLGPDVALAVRIGYLPVTRLHDEHVLFRCTQILEMLHAYLGRRLEVAGQALRRGDALVAAGEIDRAISRVRLSRPLNRMLSTVPASSLEIIRAHSGGRGAERSRLSRRVEWICAAFRAVAGTLDPGVAALLVDQMTTLDEECRAMNAPFVPVDQLVPLPAGVSASVSAATTAATAGSHRGEALVRQPVRPVIRR